MAQKMTVAVLGASDKPERYSNRAIRELVLHGYDVIPVHPMIPSVEGIPVVARLGNIHRPFDVISVYVRPQVTDGLIDEIISCSPRVVVFNPGTESPDAERRLSDAGIGILHACTITTVRTDTFGPLISTVTARQ